LLATIEIIVTFSCPEMQITVKFSGLPFLRKPFTGSYTAQLASTGISV
jgi:hypothetical protein